MAAIDPFDVFTQSQAQAAGHAERYVFWIGIDFGSTYSAVAYSRRPLPPDQAPRDLKTIRFGNG